MTFLNPTYFWALLAFVVPLAIHLWSRKKVKVIKVGSTKFLKSLDPKQTSSIKLNEILLLIIRMLCIAMLVLILAEPRLKSDEPNTRVTYLFEPALLSDSRLVSLIDSLPESSVRLLKSGFPAIDQDEINPDVIEIPEYWQLAQEMENLATDSIVVFTRALQSGLKGMRPEIKSNVHWVALDSEKSKDKWVAAFSNEKEVKLLKMLKNDWNVSFMKEAISIESERISINETSDSISIISSTTATKLPIKKDEPLIVQIYFEEPLSDQMRFLESAFGAIGKYLDRSIEVRSDTILDKVQQEDFEYLVWLSEKPLSVDAEKTLLYRPDIFAEQLIVPALEDHHFNLTGLLNTENVIREHFAEQLVATMDLHAELSKKIGPYDHRVVDVRELAPIKSVVEKERKYSRLFDLSPWVWVALTLLLIFERFISKLRKQ